MATQVSGDTGVSQVQDGIVSTNKLAANAVTPAKTQVGSLPSMVRLNTANGYGSTNTKIRRFTNVVTNQGSDITYADSATLGASFTINANGVYAINYSDQFTAASELGISLNTTTPTTGVFAIAANEILISGTTPAANYAEASGWVGYLVTGSVVRAHTSGAATGSQPNMCQFTITRVA